MEQRSDVHLEDVVVPESVERPRGWDPDEEFGYGVEKKILDALAQEVEGDSVSSALFMAYYRILAGTSFGSPEQQRKVIAATSRKISSSVYDENWLVCAAREANYYTLTGKHFATAEQREKMNETLVENIESGLGRDSGLIGIANDVAVCRRLSGRSFGTLEQQEKMRSALEEGISTMLPLEDWLAVAEDMVPLRILRAHDIKFIPGKGIEIIDDLPEPFERKGSPLPETRNF